MSFGVPISPIIRRLRGHATNINSVDCDCYDYKPSVWGTTVFFSTSGAVTYCCATREVSIKILLVMPNVFRFVERSMSSRYFPAH